MKIPETTQGSGSSSDGIPEWIKSNAEWWAAGQIDDNTFVSGIKASKIIKQVKNNFIDSYKVMKNIVSIHATFSSEVSEEDLNGIQKKLSSNLNKDAELTFEVDSSLIGGARFRIDNMYLDTSVKSQLKNIKSDLMKI